MQAAAALAESMDTLSVVVGPAAKAQEEKEEKAKMTSTRKRQWTIASGIAATALCLSGGALFAKLSADWASQRGAIEQNTARLQAQDEQLDELGKEIGNLKTDVTRIGTDVSWIRQQMERLANDE